MINYEEMYSQMSDEELLRLEERQSSLVDEAREAVCAEVQKRGGVAAIRTRLKKSHRTVDPLLIEPDKPSLNLFVTFLFPIPLFLLLLYWEELDWFPKHLLDPESRTSLLMWVIILFFAGPYSFVMDLLKRKKP